MNTERFTIARQRMSKANIDSDFTLVFSGLAMIAVAYGLARFSYGLFLPQFRTEFALSPTLLGVIAGGSYFGYCVAILLSSSLSPRIGPRKVVVGAGIVAAAGMAMISMSTSGFMLAAGVLLAGMSTGLASPPMGDAVRMKVQAHRQEPANSWINSGTSLGVLVSSPIALLAGDYWRTAWLIFTAGAILVTLWCYFTLPAGTPGSRDTRRAVVANPRWITGKSVPLLAASFFMGFASAVYWTFSRDFIVVTGGISEDISMLFWVVIGVAGFLGGLAGNAVQRFGLITSLRFSLAGFGVAIAALAMAPGVHLIVFLSAVAFGALYIMLTGIFLVWGVAVFSERPSLGIALSFMTIAIGQVVGSPLAGYIAGTMGAGTAFWLFGAISVLAMVIRPYGTYQLSLGSK